MSTEFKSGVIFACETLNRQFVFGRILLDLPLLFRNKKLDKHKSHLSFFKECYLVEAYDQLSNNKSYMPVNVLIKGILLDDYAIEKSLWEVVDFKEVTPEQIDFPEYFMRISGQYYFAKGEVTIPINLTYQEYERYSCFACILSGGAFTDYVLNYMNRKDLIHESWRDKSDLSSADLRYNSPLLRENIYEMIGEDPNVSYSELANKYDFDTSRLLK